MDRRQGGPQDSDPQAVVNVAYQHDGLYLKGIHADGVRVAWGVLRVMLGLPHTPDGERAMAIALNAHAGWQEAHPVAQLVAKHEKRLLASGQGTPEEVRDQLTRVRS